MNVFSNLYTRRSCIFIPTYTGTTSITKVKLPVTNQPPIQKQPCSSSNDVNNNKLPVIHNPAYNPQDPCTQLPVSNSVQPIVDNNVTQYVTSVTTVDITNNNFSGIVTVITDFNDLLSVIISDISNSLFSSNLQLQVSNNQLSTVRIVDGFVLYDDLICRDNDITRCITNSSIKIKQSITEKVNYFSQFFSQLRDLLMLFNKYKLTSFQNIINLRTLFGEKQIEIPTGTSTLTFSDILLSSLLPQDLTATQITSVITVDKTLSVDIGSVEGSFIRLQDSTLQYSSYVAIPVTDLQPTRNNDYLPSFLDTILVQNLLSTNDVVVLPVGYIGVDTSTEYVSYYEDDISYKSVVTGNTISELVMNISKITRTTPENVKYVPYSYKFLPVEQGNTLFPYNSITPSLYSLMELYISRKKRQKFWLVLQVSTKPNKTRSTTTRDIVNSFFMISVNIYNKLVTVKLVPFTRDYIQECSTNL